MAQYKWDKFCQYVRRNPQCLPKIRQLIEYIIGPSCRKYCDKSEREFGKVILFVWGDTTLSRDATQFLAERIFPYLKENKTGEVKEKLSSFSPSDTGKALKILESLVKSAPKKQPGRFGLWQKSRGKTPASGPVIVRPSVQTAKKKPMGKSPMDGALLNAFKEETFCSAAPPVTSFWTKLMPKEGILMIAAPLPDQALESFRVETLVSFRAGGTVRWTPLPNERDLLKSRGKDVLKILSGMVNHSGVLREKRQQINQLKNALLIRTKLLTQSEIIINVINQGMRSFNHTLDRLSRIVSDKKINRKAREYLLFKAEELLAAHGVAFRKQVENCREVKQLDEFLEKYALQSYSTVKHYPELRIIRSVKLVYQNYRQNPKKLAKILNKYLGAHGEVNIKEKLSQLLITSDVDLALFKKIEKETKLARVVERLERIQNHPKATIHTKKLYRLVQTFSDPQTKSSFSELKTGLNRLAPMLARRIVIIARISLQKEVNQQLEIIMKNRANALEGLRKLEKLLDNPRYHDPNITIYGISLQSFHDKLNSVDSRTPNLEYMVKHVFSGIGIPRGFASLIASAKKEQLKAGKKTVESCIMQLQKIQERIKRREQFQLHKELRDLLQSHGKVEFSEDPTFASITGYEIANRVNMYYNDPKRTTIDLPQYIIPVLCEPLKKMIDKERARQLKKMGR